MKLTILSPEDWAELSEAAHLVAFDRRRPCGTDRIDYAAVAEDSDGTPVGYITVHEVDAETTYWQFGGSFPGSRGTAKVVRAYEAFLDWTKRAGYRHVFTLIDNMNTPMLRLAMKVGFRIMGAKLHDGRVLVEHCFTHERSE